MIGYTIGLLISSVANFILKELVFRPLYGNTKSIPILGRGLRPPGAMNCGNYTTCPKKPSRAKEIIFSRLGTAFLKNMY